MFSGDDLLNWRVFLSLYKTCSIQDTAVALEVDNSSVSRRISFLEKQLGTKLFDRSVRPFVPTTEAHDIFVYAQEMIVQREKIRRYYSEKQEDDTRIIRVMHGSGFKIVPDLICQYSQMFPKLRFNMISPMNLADYLDGKADVIGVSSHVPLPNNVMLPRRRIAFMPLASPQYLEKHGPINHPKELINHRVFLNQFKDHYLFSVDFPLVKNGQMAVFSSQQNIRFSNITMVKQAVMDGQGIALSLAPYHCIDELEEGKLVPILNGWHRPSQANFIAVKDNDWKIKTIRNFASWWAEQFNRYEKECEDRLVKLYGQAFLDNLLRD